MNIGTLFVAAAAALVLITASGCAVTRGQETTGAYSDDTAITTKVKARFGDDLKVDAGAWTAGADIHQARQHRWIPRLPMAAGLGYPAR